MSDLSYCGPVERLDRAVAATAAISRTAARALIAAGSVFLNGRRCKVASRTVRPGDRLRVGAAAPAAPPPLSVLFEGDGVLAIDKPAGMPSAPTRQAATGTALTELGAQRDGRPLWLVHRLDAAASGVLLFATTRAAAAALSAAFRDRRVEKTYLALVDGQPQASAGVIDSPLATRAGRAHVDPRGRPARTAWRVEERRGATTLLAVEPGTGRLHQIRAHLAAIGHPIVGDRFYGGSPAPRLMLHARSIALSIDGRRLAISAPWTPD
ncbi:MAG TPA: RluA family pseudouridine synthase [Candidatus Dormibacteraeota bacterium]|nr:RluA family pseudouridine synthase [Candidatus Dormibacteraeota bacterium]